METQTVAATRVTADEIKARMDRGERFTFIDTRNPTAWAESKEKLPSAIRIPTDELVKHIGDLPRDRTIITCCT